VGPDRAPPPHPESFRTPQGAPFARDPRRSVFYVVRGSCTWRLLPHDDFPPWKTVYHYFRLFWRIDDTWEELHEALRRSRARVRLGRNPQPSAAGIVDSQSVKTTGGVGAEERGFDAGKKVKGTLSAICLWTPRGWCSRRRSTRPTSSTATMA
jgi:putative transposase